MEVGMGEEEMAVEMVEEEKVAVAVVPCLAGVGVVTAVETAAAVRAEVERTGPNRQQTAGCDRCTPLLPT